MQPRVSTPRADARTTMGNNVSLSQLTWPAATGTAAGVLVGAAAKQGARQAVVPLTAVGLLLFGLNRGGYVDFNRRKMRADAAEAVKQLDVNGDGKVDAEDALEAARRLKAGFAAGDVAAATGGFGAGVWFGFMYF